MFSVQCGMLQSPWLSVNHEFRQKLVCEKTKIKATKNFTQLCARKIDIATTHFK